MDPRIDPTDEEDRSGFPVPRIICDNTDAGGRNVTAPFVAQSFECKTRRKGRRRRHDECDRRRCEKAS
jgi:hypothetical protein